MGSGSAVFRAVLVAAVAGLLLVFAGAASSRPDRAAERHNWQLLSAKLEVGIERDGLAGPITAVQIAVPNSPCDGGGGTGLTATTLGPFVSNLPVAADGSFSYDGDDEAVPGNSHLQLQGRFNGTKVSGTFTYSALYPSGDTCHTAAPMSFTASCIDCPQPGGSGKEKPAGSALTSADRFVPNRQIGRAPLGSSLAAFRARYPRDLWRGGHADKRTGGRISFFRLDRRSVDGDPHGLALMVISDRNGRIWSQSAQTFDLNDRSSWLRGANGIGIGSTLAEVRRAYSSVKCGDVSSSTCSLVQSKPASRWTLFAFDRDVRATRSAAAAPARVRALVVQCLGPGGCTSKLPPRPQPAPRR